MANILGLAALAGNAAQDQIVERRKDKALQDREEEYASRRGMRDNAAAFEDEKVTQGRKDLSKAATDKQAIQDAIKKAAVTFDTQNSYGSMSTPDGASSDPGPAPQSSAGMAPLAQTPAAATDTTAAPMAAGGIAGSTPTPARAAGASPVKSAADPTRSMERAAYIAQAVADQHLTNGDMTGYKQASDDAIHMRDALRAQRFNQADALYAQTGDATVYAKMVYPLVHDGYSLVDAKQTVGPDGSPVVTMTRRNDQTGKVETTNTPLKAFISAVSELRKPGTLAALEEKIAAEKRDVENKIAVKKPELQNAMDIAKLKDATDRITAGAHAEQAHAAAGYYRAQTNAIENTGTQGPVWDKEADGFLKSKYTVKDEATGATSVDGDGLQFAKQVALAQAKRNGGDTTSALGYAFEADNQLKAKAAAAAAGDPKADIKALLKAERANYLKILTTPKPAPANPGGANTPASPTPGAILPESKALPDAGQVAARDAGINNMNQLSGTSTSRRTELIAQRQQDVSANFDNMLSMIKPGMARADAFKVLSWFDDNADLLTNAQRKQLRAAKSNAGV